MLQQYCPKCLGSTLKIKSSGVIHIMINGMQRDSGRILFNLKHDKHIVKEDLHKKIVDFFKWYSSFQNKEPIKNIKLYSNDFVCSAGCSLEGKMFSVIDVLFSSGEIYKLLEETAKDYPLSVQLTPREIE